MKSEGDGGSAGWPALADPWLGLAARVLVGLVFIVSGALKAAAPAEEFALVIESYDLVRSADLILVMATFLPWLEVIAGFALVFGYLARPAAAAAGGMLLAFVAAILSTKFRGLELPNCGCFGWGFHPSPSQALVMDALLSAAAAQAFRRGAELLSLDNWRRAGCKAG